jgi:hypothetical protein
MRAAYWFHLEMDKQSVMIWINAFLRSLMTQSLSVVAQMQGWSPLER